MVSQIFLLFKMEKTGKISNLERKSEFKLEKKVKISNLRRKNEFKMEKRVKISIFGLAKEAWLKIIS